MAQNLQFFSRHSFAFSNIRQTFCSFGSLHSELEGCMPAGPCVARVGAMIVI